MPIYEYRRADGTTFEVLQKFSDDPLTKDPETGKPVQRVLSAPAIHFKGSGFYNTDYGKKKRGGGSSEKDESKGSSGSSDSSSSSSSESKSDSNGSSKSDAKPSGGDAKTSSSSSSSSD